MKKTTTKTRAAKEIKRLKDLRPDPKNANRHTERGGAMMETSLQSYGYGDSMTVDRNGVVLSGNQRLETLATIGLDRPIVVKSDGTRPIVHQRTDLDANDPRARALALAMNRVGQVNLDLDPELVAEVIALDPSVKALWSEKELVSFFANRPAPEDFPEVGSDLATEHTCPKCGYRWSGGEVTKKGRALE